MIQSLDQVQVGDFLTCVLGPYKEPRRPTSFWDFDEGDAPKAKQRDKAWLGVVVRVTAIQAPVMMVEVFQPPSSTRRTCESYSVVLDFREAGWVKSTPAYLMTYLNAIKAKVKEVEQAPRASVLTLFNMHKMYEDIFGTRKPAEGDKTEPVSIVEFHPTPEPIDPQKNAKDLMEDLRKANEDQAKRDEELDRLIGGPLEYIDDEDDEEEESDGHGGIVP